MVFLREPRRERKTDDILLLSEEARKEESTLFRREGYKARAIVFYLTTPYS